jgi:hypothetical protein
MGVYFYGTDEKFDGKYSITARAVDAANNASQISFAVILTVE